MATTFTSRAATCRLGAKVTKESADGSTQINDFFLSFAPTVPSDTTIWFHNIYTIASAGSQTLDLSGALTDLLGQSCVFTKLYGMLIVNTATVAGTLIHVGNSNFAAFLGSATDLIKVGPNGGLFLFRDDGYTVTNSTADILTIAVPGGAGVDVKVGLIGK